MMAETSDFLVEARGIAERYFSRLNSDSPIEHKYVEGADAYRFYQNVRGGAAIIVGRDHSFLFANSSVPPAKHEAAFLGGRRTDPEVFNKKDDPERP